MGYVGYLILAKWIREADRKREAKMRLLGLLAISLIWWLGGKILMIGFDKEKIDDEIRAEMARETIAAMERYNRFYGG